MIQNRNIKPGSLLPTALSPNLRAQLNVKLATTGVLPACTYSAQRQALIANANGALGQIDGVDLAPDDYLYVKNQVATVNNGVYRLVDGGTAGSPWILQRVNEMLPGQNVSGQVIYVRLGTANAGTLWTIA